MKNREAVKYFGHQRGKKKKDAYQEMQCQEGSSLLMKKWISSCDRSMRLVRWVSNRWMYSLRKKRCSTRRQMQHMTFRRYVLKSLAKKKFSHMLVTEVSFLCDNKCVCYLSVAKKIDHCLETLLN